VAAQRAWSKDNQRACRPAKRVNSSAVFWGASLLSKIAQLETLGVCFSAGVAASSKLPGSAGI
jgi:hypothetical protein